MDVELIRLTKRYGTTTAVDAIDLKVPAAPIAACSAPPAAARPRPCG